MANVPGVILETGQGITVTLPTARLPELPRFVDIADDDLVSGFDASDNKTKAMTIAMLRDKMVGEGVPTTPVLPNGIVQLVVDAVHQNNLRWDLPSLAGKQFTLERRGIGMLTTDEYQVLSTGGFLLTGDSPAMELSETFILTITQLQGGEGAIIGGSGSAFITGIVVVTDNTVYSDSHKNKLIAISGGTGTDAKKVAYTLPDVTLVPENLIIPLETNINNKYQPTISTQAGQFIYFNSRSYSSLYMGLGESLWLFAASDGWYVISSFGNFQSIGEIIPSYKGDKLNTIIAMGQLLKRDEYPRLWQEVQGYGAALVTDDQKAPGLWTTGDGSTTFRVPDLRAMFIRGLDYGAARDGDRISAGDGSKVGSFQPNENKSHQHTNIEADNSAHGSGSTAHNTPTPILVNQDSGGDLGHAVLPGSATGFTGGHDSRPDNIALFYLIKT